VINTTRLTAGTTTHPDHVTFAAGLPTAQALHRTVEAGLSGLVWAAGLPGTLGGAAAGNAGCWGGDMATSTNYLDVIDGEGQAHRVQGVDLAWAYRELKLPATIAEPWCIVAISIQVESDNPATLRVDYEQLQARKRALQPIGVRNSGCIFRNPEGGAAGAILDAAGCKGQQVGGAVVSSQHANFIVNDGDATAADIETLIAQLVATAREHQDVVLEPEIRRW
jgi:UDP-N-acetylmuramate dehydrogenase